MAVRVLLIAMTVSGLILSGCVKKPKQAALQNVQAPQVDQSADAADSADVFNKYYRDSVESAKNISKTFSMTEPESYTPVFSRNGRYVVQVAAMGSRWLADELATEFKEKGYPAYVAEVTNPTAALQGTYYRVRISGFPSIPDAKAFGDNVLRPANYDYWVDRKANDNTSMGDQGSSSYGYTPSSNTPQSTYTPAPQPAPEARSTPSTDAGSQNSGASWRSDSGSGW